MKAVVVYYSRGGTTKKMAEIIHQELNDNGIESDIFSVSEITAKAFLDYDGIVIGSPTYYGTLAAPVKALLDESVSFHGKLDGKVGAAFSSAANIAGGNETTVLSILQAMLIHGIIVQGDFKGDHYGPVAVGSVDKRCEENCMRLAQRFVKLLNRVAGSK
ncbi:MAG: flavodoxin family protein [Candidatus Omnitrophica bacterium]|nr:flavodoxin family protein [Candidatus Omnitrophota bacterium]MDD5429239.1 flavodoxin family protein [Candidatus Omnitrophota bacterium]